MRRTSRLLAGAVAALAIVPSTARADAVTTYTKADGSVAITVAVSGPGGQALFTVPQVGFPLPANGQVPIPGIKPGAKIAISRDGVDYETLTYTGLPTPAETACAGSTSFALKVDANTSPTVLSAFTVEESQYASARDFNHGWSSFIGGTWTANFPRPLRLGETLSITSDGVIPWRGGTARSVSTREFIVGACTAPAPVPTGSADLKAAGKALAKLDPSKLSRKKSTTLTVAVSAAGTLKLKLTAKSGKKTVTLGSGSKTAKAAGKVKVSVKLTKQGRKLLKRSKKLKVTLASTFTPAGTGAKPVAQKVAVTLKRKAKQ